MMRLAAFLAGVVGLVLVAWFLVTRRDPGRSGPVARRLMGLGFLFLSWLGLGCRGRTAGDLPGREARTGRRAARSGRPSPGLRSKEESTVGAALRRIQSSFFEAWKVVEGKRGRYPFDTRGKKRLLQDLQDAQRLIGELRRAGRLGPAWARFLRLEGAFLESQVAVYRPVEMKRTSCYAFEPMPLELDVAGSRQRLLAREALLAKMAEARAVDPAVVNLAQEIVRRDLNILSECVRRHRCGRRDEVLRSRVGRLLQRLGGGH